MESIITDCGHIYISEAAILCVTKEGRLFALCSGPNGAKWHEVQPPMPQVILP